MRWVFCIILMYWVMYDAIDNNISWLSLYFLLGILSSVLNSSYTRNMWAISILNISLIAYSLYYLDIRDVAILTLLGLVISALYFIHKTNHLDYIIFPSLICLIDNSLFCLFVLNIIILVCYVMPFVVDEVYNKKKGVVECITISTTIFMIFMVCQTPSSAFTVYFIIGYFLMEI